MAAAVLPMPEEQLVLSDEGRAALEDLVRGVLKEEESARRLEVRNAWKQRSFKNGKQHIWYDKTSYCFMLPQASGQELPRFMDDYNIYTPHGRSIVSLLSQSPPGINFVPDDLQKSTDVTAASYAEKMRHRVDRLVHMKDRQMEACWLFCTDGRTIAWTRPDKNGQLRVTMHGVLESKVPIFARKMERWGYCVLSEEIDLYEAKDEFPDFADDIESADSMDSYERMARMGVLSARRGTSVDGLKSLCTIHTAWIRPSRFRKAPDDLRKELRQLYPNGVKATVISDKCVDAVPEAMEEALSVQWPMPSQGQSRPSLLHDLVPVQEAYNDIKNMCRENADYGIPATWVDGRAIDSEAMPEQRSEPGALHVINPPAGATVEQSVFQEQPAQLSAQTVAMLDALLQDAQFTTGDLPSLYGSGTPDSETYSGQKLLSDQAKGQFTPAYVALQWLFAGVYSIAVRVAAKMSGESLAISGNSGQDRFNPQQILDGNFGCYPDTDSAFPETTADKRAALQSVLTQLGNAGEGGLAIVMQPDNLKLMQQLSGLADLVIPGAEARDKQLREIEQLLQEVPVPDQSKMQDWMPQAQQAVLSGQAPPPPPMTSSIGVGKRDYHQAELDKIQEWLSSSACYEEQQKGNHQGIQNVELHGDLHEAAIAAAQPKPQGKPPNVTMSVQVTDPAAITQLLAEAGVQTTPDDIAASQVPVQQEQAANTQHKAAQAQHQAVLAAKEAVAPVKPVQAPRAPESKHGR